MTARRLITEADILAGRVTGPLVLGPDTLVTPAALDRAMILGWQVVEGNHGESPPQVSAAGEVAPSAGCSGAASCSGCGKCSGRGGCAGRGEAAADAAPGVAAQGDGLYLVRVVGGRTVAVHRATES